MQIVMPDYAPCAVLCRVVLPLPDSAGPRLLPLPPRAPPRSQATEPAARSPQQHLEARRLWIGEGIWHPCPDFHSRGTFSLTPR